MGIRDAGLVLPKQGWSTGPTEPGGREGGGEDGEEEEP